jgi:dTDP-4-amino-4,6-dideoxygalactose transaminase
VAGGWKYDIVYPGFKMNMPDICAAIGLAQLRKYDSLILPERRRVVQEYQNAFSSLAWAELPPFDNSTKKSSYHLFPLRIRNISEVQRDRMMDIIASKEVSVNVHFIPLPLHTAFRERGYRMDDYPVAYDNYSREISLPVYPQLDPSMVRYVIDAVVAAYKQVIHD